MAQELFRGYTRETGIPKCTIKVDLHKAFDSISWDFIMNMLEKMEFPIRVRNWIYSCISTPSYSVKINGSLRGFF